MRRHPDFEIRGMRASDYPELVGLWKEAGLKYHPRGRDSKKRILREMEGPMATFLVAEAGCGLVGSLLGTTDGRKGWINRLAVHPEWQRRGLALALLEEMERRFDERGILVFCALIQGDNDPSIALFRSAGYKEDRSVVYYSKRRGRYV